MSYVGGNTSRGTNGNDFRRCFDSCFFGLQRPCLVLISTDIWINPWAIIENVQIPDKET